MPHFVAFGLVLVVLQFGLGFLPHGVSIVARVALWLVLIVAGLMWLGGRWGHETQILSQALEPR